MKTHPADRLWVFVSETDPLEMTQDEVAQCASLQGCSPEAYLALVEHEFGPVVITPTAPQQDSHLPAPKRT